VNRHGPTLLSQHDYTYDGAGNRDTHTELIAGTTTPYKYIYDPLNRLTEVRNNTCPCRKFRPARNSLYLA
jgi:hypothetical protein